MTKELRHPNLSEVSLFQALHALGDPVRLDVVRKLFDGREHGTRELLGDRPKSSVSYHFAVLREAGLVRTSEHGTAHRHVLRRSEFEERFPGFLGAIVGILDSSGHTRAHGNGRRGEPEPAP